MSSERTNSPDTKGQSAGGRAGADAGQMMDWRKDAFDLISDCERSARYHSHRRAFFDTWHRWMMVGVLLSGSGVVVSLNSTFGWGSEITTGMALFTALVGAVDVVWGLTHKARDHEVLFRRFFDLAKRIRPHEADAESFSEWRSNIMEIFADEPATYYALNAECHNAVVQSVGAPREQMQKIGFWPRRLRNLVRYTAVRFPTYEQIGEDPPT